LAGHNGWGRDLTRNGALKSSSHCGKTIFSGMSSNRFKPNLAISELAEHKKATLTIA
jgi:hypothetical protein